MALTPEQLALANKPLSQWTDADRESFNTAGFNAALDVSNPAYRQANRESSLASLRKLSPQQIQANIAQYFSNTNDLAHSVDRYVNWNQPGKDNQAAEQERRVALAMLEAAKYDFNQTYGQLGYKFEDLPQVKEYQTKLGSAPGGGQTSEQTAALDKVASGTSTTPPAAGTSSQGAGASQIQPNFIPGLTDTQKQSITNLVQNKPVDQWTATDLKNWNYATKNQALPSSSGTTSNPQDGSQNGTTNSSANTAGGAPDISSQREALTKLGVDVTGLNDDQVGTLAAMNQVLLVNADKNKNIVPASLSPADMQNFLAQAHSEIDPYYAEQLRTGSADILNAVADLSGDTSYAEQQTKAKFDADQKALASQMADAGLAFSGMRNQATQKLNEQETGLVKSQSSQIQRQLRDQANQFEKTYGSDALSKLNIPALSYMGISVAPPAGYGNLMGTQAKDQAVAVSGEQNNLAQQELDKRNNLLGIPPASATAL